MTGLESERGRLISRHRTMAEEAADALMAALRLADLPPLVSLSPVYATGHEYGGHVALGGANARTVMAIAQYIAEHAECTGRIIPGELLTLRRELST
ncbi:hypothetical protein [Kitasatospora sp. MAP5-34]|uniref:hypothetical protein n=1 Tax=Kitasatospora sp. MAP5-34 TaxID=3035102 RepID=UPI0024740642|nr:hypothetical protein [Kitasatospora sp. MAP5-34]MDH6579494.1 hypothetical protein [Kitasatospora sp. MAP5-34]